jgi:hypothetical protein
MARNTEIQVENKKLNKILIHEKKTSMQKTIQLTPEVIHGLI